MKGIRVRIAAKDSRARALLERAQAEGLVLVGDDDAADLVATLVEPTPVPSDITLNAREKEILEYLVDGWSNVEIASVLRLRVRTVRYHLENLYQKLGVTRRGEAVREALSLGLVRFNA